VYAGRVLSGAKTGELPIERPARFFLTVNRKAAKVQELSIPSSLLLQADQVIE
jgi:putative ABC transport system substrate-binding protein